MVAAQGGHPPDRHPPDRHPADGLEAVRMIAEQHGARLVFGIGKGRFRATLLWPVRPYEVEDDPEDLPF